MGSKIAVFFDCGGVLLHDMCNELLRDSVRSIHGDALTDELFDRMVAIKGEVWPIYEVDQCSEMDFWKYLIKKFPMLDHETPASLAEKLRETRMLAYYGAIAVAEELKKAGNFVGVISNHSRDWFEYGWKKFELQTIFDPENVVVSYAVRSMKPQLEIFHHALQIANKKGFNHPFFIDDKMKNVEVATALGFQGIHFQSKQDDYMTLRKYLKLF